LFYYQSYRIMERLIQNLISTDLEAKDMIANSLARDTGYLLSHPMIRW